MELQIPSPSVFLRRSPGFADPPSVAGSQSIHSISTASTKQASRPTTVTVTSSSTSSSSNGIQKPKQSKSRNGCITCKQKRLKCDETKPACIQCQKRSVYCEGYKKDYKWRTFEETSRNSKATKARKTQNHVLQTTFDDNTRLPPSFDSSASPKGHYQLPPSNLHYAFTSATQAFSGSSPVPEPQVMRTNSTISYPSQVQPTAPTSHLTPSRMPLTTAQSHCLQQDHQTFPSLDPPQYDSFEQSAALSRDSTPTPTEFGAPDTDLHPSTDPSEYRPPHPQRPYSLDLATSYHANDTTTGESESELEEDLEEADEEIPRLPDQNIPQTQLELRRNDSRVRPLPPELSVNSPSSRNSVELLLHRSPHESPASSDALIYRFSIQTSGILSVRNGKTENPWRELIWPLAKDCPALFHAITSMSALQGAQHDKQSWGEGERVKLLKIAGVQHMQQSMKKLSAGLQTMSLDASLATSLALALGEGWDDKISTGIQHLKGAKFLITAALTRQNQSLGRGQFNAESARRLRFLCNTFVYLDVIARLTSKEPQEDFDFGSLLADASQHLPADSVEVDPLMGCATTLFPIIGRVATLIQKVRDPQTKINSLVIEEASRLKEQLERWQPPPAADVQQPEDPDLAVQDAICTAESYRLATLLYLYQAVPEVATEPTFRLARKTLQTIMKVRDNSQIIIVQIYPLLVGSCEMTTPEDRVWVRNRWSTMINRLAILNVESCWKLVQEVWKRRDLFAAVKAQNLPLQQFSPHVMPPKLKRKMYSADTPSQADFFGELRLPWKDPAQDRRLSKRRLTLDAPIRPRSPYAASTNVLFPSRCRTDRCVTNIEPEYTVRGGLHWLSVMTEWEWEIFLG